MHSSSLYGKKPTRGDRMGGPQSPTTYDHQMEDQVHQENEAMINALGTSVKSMKAMAARLNQEAEEQNSLLKSVNTAFVSARRGVGVAINGVQEMARTYGWRYIVLVAILIFAALYLGMKLLFFITRSKPAPVQ